MASHGICFDFYYWPKPSQTGQNGSAAAADAPLAGCNDPDPIVAFAMLCLLLLALE